MSIGLKQIKWYCDFCKEDNHYKGREWYGGGNLTNECFLNSNRSELLDHYKSKDILERYYKSDIDKVLSVYKRLTDNERFDWRKALSTCIDRHWHAV